ncbi:MAG: hypothetical protein AAGE65_07230 [Planctomycetota bacterium]
MPAFDAYCLMDFSARSSPSPVRPSADACWLGACAPGERFAAAYFRTRAAAMAAWSAWVTRQVEAKRRVLAGFDFAFGYPAGFAAAAKLEPAAQPWRVVWQTLARHIEDDDRNRNNRFAVASRLNEQAAGRDAGPFWGGPPTMLAGCRRLRPRRPFAWPYLAHNGTALPRLRLTDTRAKHAQEAWKLAGIGSVGSQSLLGIAALGRLLGWGDAPPASWTPHAQVWPFQTGFQAPATPPGRPAVTLVEAFPSLLEEQTQRRLNRHGRIRDAAQVDAWCHWAKERDRVDRLDAGFAPPAGLTDTQRSACVAEEGWIFGLA